MLDRGQTDRARDLAERTPLTDPWHEPADRLLVATHHAGHDELAVRRALDRYCGVLHELGIDNPEAGAMARRLVDNLPPRRPWRGRTCAATASGGGRGSRGWPG